MKPAVTMIVVACATVAAVAFLLARRAEQPDSYPEFSSYRTLPEGTSVLYEALRRAPGMAADRNIHPLSAAHFNGAAVLLLGTPSFAVDFDGAEQLAKQGNRVIIGLIPYRARFIQPKPGQTDQPLKRWNVRLDYFRAGDFREDREDAVTPGWPAYFAEAKGWDTLRSQDDKPVVVQKSMGKGAIVLMANSYLLSNAAMVDDRQTAFVANLIGPAHVAIFDETHFGIEETGSVAALGKRYHLQGFALGLMVVAALFIWKSAAGFPPAAARAASGDSVYGEDSAASFLNLLRRNIKPNQIVGICVEEWRKMYQRRAGSRVPSAAALPDAGRQTPAQAYLEIQQVVGAKHKSL